MGPSQHNMVPMTPMLTWTMDCTTDASCNRTTNPDTVVGISSDLDAITALVAAQVPQISTAMEAA